MKRSMGSKVWKLWMNTSDEAKNSFVMAPLQIEEFLFHIVFEAGKALIFIYRFYRIKQHIHWDWASTEVSQVKFSFSRTSSKRVRQKFWLPSISQSWWTFSFYLVFWAFHNRVEANIPSWIDKSLNVIARQNQVICRYAITRKRLRFLRNSRWYLLNILIIILFLQLLFSMN